MSSCVDSDDYDLTQPHVDLDLVMRLRLVDKSNLNACRGVLDFSEYGFKVNLFAAKENGKQWLPHTARENDVVILQKLKVSLDSSCCI